MRAASWSFVPTAKCGLSKVGACQNSILSGPPPPALVGLYSALVGACAKPALARSWVAKGAVRPRPMNLRTRVRRDIRPAFTPASRSRNSCSSILSSCRRGSVKMAGHHVLRGDFFADRRLARALRHSMRTPRMKAAARWWIERARDLAADRQLFISFIGMRRQGCGKQRLRVGVERFGAELQAVGELDDLPEIHNGNPMADMGHRRQVMADEEIADPQRLLQMLQLVHDLRADRHVERRDRFIEYDQTRMRRQSSGDCDPLALPAAELVREQPRQFRLKPHEFKDFRHALAERFAREVGVNLQRLGNDVADPHARTERA